MNLWQSKQRRFYELVLVVIGLCFIASIVLLVVNIPKPTPLEVAVSVGWVMLLTFLWLLNWSFRQHALADEILINHQLEKVTKCVTEVSIEDSHLPDSKPAAELWSVIVFEIKRRKVYPEYYFVLEKSILFFPATLCVYQNTELTELLKG